MGCGDNAIGVGLKIVIYFYIPSLGHTLAFDGSKFYVSAAVTLIILFLHSEEVTKLAK